jgi:hypothetical protein
MHTAFSPESEKVGFIVRSQPTIELLKEAGRRDLSNSAGHIKLGSVAGRHYQPFFDALDRPEPSQGLRESGIRNREPFSNFDARGLMA